MEWLALDTEEIEHARIVCKNGSSMEGNLFLVPMRSRDEDDVPQFDFLENGGLCYGENPQEPEYVTDPDTWHQKKMYRPILCTFFTISVFWKPSCPCTFPDLLLHRLL